MFFARLTDGVNRQLAHRHAFQPLLGHLCRRDGVIQGGKDAHLMNGVVRLAAGRHFQQYRFHHLFNILLIHDVQSYLWKIT